MADIVKLLNAEIDKTLDTPSAKKLLEAQVLYSVKAAPSEVELRTKRDADAWVPIGKLGIAQ